MEDVYDLVVICAGRPEFSEVCLPGSASSHSSLIHSTAWNINSANFAFWDFCELRVDGVLLSWTSAFANPQKLTWSF